MNEEIMNEIQPVRPKDQFTFSCRQCGACCRNIEGCVMVESLDAYRLARYLRTKGELIEGIEDFLFRYCDPEPLTEEGFPIYMLKTKAPNGSCIFLMDGRCSVYPARTRTCRIYPLTVGPGERGRDFEYCLCLDRRACIYLVFRCPLTVSAANRIFYNCAPGQSGRSGADPRISGGFV